MGQMVETSGPNEAYVYPQAIVLSVLSFPAWILCVTSVYWHFSKHNIAAGSLILWIAMNNFYNSINPLIWPRDPVNHSWDGRGWCDINVRIQVGSTVGIAASTAMIVRRLGKVMDTRNITLANRNSQFKETMLEIVWCWIYPLVMIIVYYVVQPSRYLIYGIAGCVSAFHPSWPSVVLNFMWAPITMLVAAFYALILIYRLYRYRREFHRLVTGGNTTKSRFIRLFVICALIILIYLPVSIWMLAYRWSLITSSYSWNEVHGLQFNQIVKYPFSDQILLEKWGQVATGYIVFFVFGTSTDSHNLHKTILLKLGLGKFFPSLYVMRESEGSLLRSLLAARKWSSNLSTKAKNMFHSRASSVSSSFTGTAHRDSKKAEFSTTVTSEDTATTSDQPTVQQHSPSTKTSFFKGIFRHAKHPDPTLPLFSRHTHTEALNANDSTTMPAAPGVHAHVWASDYAFAEQVGETDGVHIVQELQQKRHMREEADDPKTFKCPWI